MFLPVCVQFLVRDEEAAGKRLLSRLKVQRLLELPVTDVGSVLEAYVFLSERLVRNRKCEFPVFRFWRDHTISVVSATVSGLKTKILNLQFLIFAKVRFPPALLYDR